MKWSDAQPRLFWDTQRPTVWTVLLGSGLGAAIATALGWFIQLAQAIVK